MLEPFYLLRCWIFLRALPWSVSINGIQRPICPALSFKASICLPTYSSAFLSSITDPTMCSSALSLQRVGCVP